MDAQSSPVPDLLDESTVSSTARSVISTPNAGGDIPVVADSAGLLTLSGREMNAVPSNCPREPPIRVLDISDNAFRTFECSLLPLYECVEVNAALNKFTRIRCFAALAKTLETLDLSGNCINSLETLNTLANLRVLNLSHNRIETFPFLDRLAHLSVLDLSHNLLPAVPNLIKLAGLTELRLAGNRIRSLQDIQKLVPAEKLRLLDLSGNLIGDLCELHHLYGFHAWSLESLSLRGNRCFLPFAENDFNYRAFVKSCVLGELKHVDGVQLSQMEMLRGEKMRLEGKTACILSSEGAYHRLCDFLRTECPPTPVEDSRLQKVLEKRREYTTQQNTSVASGSYANTSADETSLLDASRQSSARQSPFFGRKKTTTTNLGPKTTPVKSSPLKTKQLPHPSSRTNTPTPTPPFVAGRTPPPPLEFLVPNAVPTPTRLTHAGTSSSSNVSSSTVVISRSEAPGDQFRTDSPPPPTISQASAVNDHLEQRVKILEESLQDFQASMFSILGKLVPTPVCVRHKRQSQDSVLLSWDNVIPLLAKVEGYEMSVNGVPVGRVVAAHRRAEIADLDPDEPSEITIQAISAFGNLRSSPVQHIVPRHRDDDEKENEEFSGGCTSFTTAPMSPLPSQRPSPPKSATTATSRSTFSTSQKPSP